MQVHKICHTYGHALRTAFKSPGTYYAQCNTTHLFRLSDLVTFASRSKSTTAATPARVGTCRGALTRVRPKPAPLSVRVIGAGRGGRAVRPCQSHGTLVIDGVTAALCQSETGSARTAGTAYIHGNTIIARASHARQTDD